MALCRSFPRRSSLLLSFTVAGHLLALEVPVGTELQVRLKTKIASNSSKPNDPVETVVIAPVMVDGVFAIPAGATVHGKVTQAKASTDPTVRAVLALDFSQIEIGNTKSKINAALLTVENARETVNSNGEVQGILANETISARLDSGIGKVAERYSGFGGILEAAKSAVLKQAEGDIVYEPGVEMDLKLTQPLTLSGPAPPGPAAELQPIRDEQTLIDLVNRQPFQSRAQNPPKPSDITTMMFIGTEDQVKGAFNDAGWSLAAGLSEKSKLETFRAIAEQRGYKEAPVSILYLDSKPPDMVFEKLNNTFSQRHHLRIWRRPDLFQGQAVWVCAATHDTGIDFSAADRTFIHKIDPQIDKERAKVVNDLLLTGKVQSLALVDRPNVPQHGQNATGDNLETDAKMAVLILK
ncbi:MAG: LssY C-terminal domain-containing protein [Bryobacteraceae bacterium]